jgi:hypothetical protein
MQYRELTVDNFKKLNFYIDQLKGLADFRLITGDRIKSLNESNFNSSVADEAKKCLDSLARQFRYIRNKAMVKKDSVTRSLESILGNEELINLKNNFENKRLKELVLDWTTTEKSIETPGKIIQKYEPVYMKPVSKYGRAQFYAPYKMLGNRKIDTFWFNVMVLWFETLVLYITLYFNLLQIIVAHMERLRFTKSDRQRRNIS